MKHGDTQITVDTNEAPKLPKPVEESPISIDKMDVNITANNEQKYAPVVDFYIAYHGKHDISALEVAYEKYQETTESEYEKQRIEAEYYYYRFMLGDHAVLPTLVAMEGRVREKESLWNVIRNIGLCYEEKNLTKALVFYDESLEKIMDPIIHAKLIVAKADCLQKKELNSRNSIILIKQALSSCVDDNIRIIFLKGLETLFKQEKEKIGEIAVLRKILAIDGTDNSSKFNLAYVYSEFEYKDFNTLDLSIAQYISLLRLTPNDPAVHNNLGVAYEKLGLTIHAVESYKRSIKLNNTLASANLGNLYIKAGFVEEAEKVLNEASKETDCHKNVIAALANIQKNSLAEDAKIELIQKNTAEKHVFLEHFADFYMIDGQPVESLIGKWENDGEFLLLTVNDNNLTGEWTAKDNKYSISGTINNATAIFVRKKILKTLLFYEEDKFGLLYFTNNKLCVCLFMQDSTYTIKFSKSE